MQGGAQLRGDVDVDAQEAGIDADEDGEGDEDEDDTSAHRFLQDFQSGRDHSQEAQLHMHSGMFNPVPGRVPSLEIVVAIQWL